MNNTLNIRSLLFGVVGLVLGLLAGYFLFGIQALFVVTPKTDPRDLDQESKVNWIVMTSESFSLNGDRNVAASRLRWFTTSDISTVLSEQIAQRNSSGRPLDAGRLQNFATAMGYTLSAAPSVPTQKPNPTPSAASSPFSLNSLLASPILLGGVALLLLLVTAGVILFILRRNPGAPAAETAGTTTATPRITEITRGNAPSAAPAPARPAPSAGAAPGTKPLGTFAATYKFGDDNYDTSFSLETSRGEFLGETGMGTSQLVGDGKPDKVTAFDLWLFDKGDVRTVTKILMSEFAYNDQALRTKLATKGELALAEKGKRVVLETATLRVEAEIVDLVYASTPGLPPNSHFQKVIVEMVPTQK